MNLEETIIFANNMTKTKYHHGMVQMGNLNDDEANFYFEEAKEALDKILNQCDRGHRVIRI